ncbi:MAG: hypothetical protein KGL39_60460, partial [Patescibacteria group bacterium]|nr:hypothetical protein [Patescibacteria group bacterium]
MNSVDPAEIFEYMSQCEADKALNQPRAWYAMGRDDKPESERGHLKFHQSNHIVRALFPGNGWGKTTAAGVEVDFWIQHDHPFLQIPPHRILVLWAMLTFKNLDSLRTQLEDECLTKGYEWNETKHRYNWTGPMGGSLTFGSN